jgi:hypothetical protein
MYHLTYKIVFGGIVGKYKQKTNITAPKQTYYVVVLQGAVCFKQRPRNRVGGNGGMCPPKHFLKVKKVPFLLGLNAPFKERKKYFLNKRPLFLETKCPFRSGKDSVKAISVVKALSHYCV